MDPTSVKLEEFCNGKLDRALRIYGNLDDLGCGGRLHVQAIVKLSSRYWAKAFRSRENSTRPLRLAIQVVPMLQLPGSVLVGMLLPLRSLGPHHGLAPVLGLLASLSRVLRSFSNEPVDRVCLHWNFPHHGTCVLPPENEEVVWHAEPRDFHGVRSRLLGILLLLAMLHSTRGASRFAS